MYHFAMVRRPLQRTETYLYRDRDHQQECTRRIADQEPLAHIVTLTSATRPQHLDLDLSKI